MLTRARQQRDKLAKCEGHVLVCRITPAAPLVHHEARQGVIVAAFYLGFGDPSGEVAPGYVFALDHDAPAHVSDAAYVAAVLRASLHAPVYSVVDMLSEVVGCLALESWSCGSGAAPVPGHPKISVATPANKWENKPPTGPRLWLR